MDETEPSHGRINEPAVSPLKWLLTTPALKAVSTKNTHELNSLYAAAGVIRGMMLTAVSFCAAAGGAMYYRISPSETPEKLILPVIGLAVQALAIICVVEGFTAGLKAIGIKNWREHSSSQESTETKFN